VERHSTASANGGFTASDDHRAAFGGARALPGRHADTAADTLGATSSNHNIATSAHIGLADLQREIARRIRRARASVHLDGAAYSASAGRDRHSATSLGTVTRSNSGRTASATAARASTEVH
jgi:hypothetical protein